MEVEHLSTMWGPFCRIPRIPNKNNQKVNLKCISEQVLSINKRPSGKLKKNLWDRYNGYLVIQDHVWLRDFSPRFLTTLGY